MLFIRGIALLDTIVRLVYTNGTLYGMIEELIMEQKGYFRTLAALKGLFILLIAVHNTMLITPLFSGVPGMAFILLFGGLFGNSMFYILSGFLLSAGYKRRIQGHSIAFPEYLRRRLKKLYPMYILSNAAVLILELIRYGVSAVNIKKIVFTLLLVGNTYNHPTSFLCALFVCYILFFAVAYFAKSPTHYGFFLTFCVAAGYILTGADLELPFLSAANGLALMNFFLGCILAEVYPLISEKLHRWLQPAFLVLVPLLLFFMLAYGVEVIAGDVKVAFGFAICPMILYLALVKGPCSRILQWKGFVALGGISSSIFFWHLVVYMAFCDLHALVTGGGTVREPAYLLYFPLMLIFSAVIQKFQEKKPAVGSRS